MGRRMVVLHEAERPPRILECGEGIVRGGIAMAAADKDSRVFQGLPLESLENINNSGECAWRTGKKRKKGPRRAGGRGGRTDGTVGKRSTEPLTSISSLLIWG